MTYKVAINGFGRIGRLVFRAILAKPELEVVAINDLWTPEQLKYLLKYDSMQGQFPYSFNIDGNLLTINTGDRKHSVKFLQIKNLPELPWKELGVEGVCESTGAFRKREELAKHLHSGCSKGYRISPTFSTTEPLWISVRSKVSFAISSKHLFRL